MATNTSNKQVAEQIRALKEDVMAMKDDMGDLMEALVNVTKSKGAEAAEHLRSSADEKFDRIRHRAAEMRDASRHAAEQVEECVRDHPFLSTTVSFGIGVLLGKFLQR